MDGFGCFSFHALVLYSAVQRHAFLLFGLPSSYFIITKPKNSRFLAGASQQPSIGFLVYGSV